MLIPISDRVKLLISETGFTYCNCIIVDDDIKAIMDTGAGPRAMEEINPASFDMVLNTHHHYDHIRGNYRFTNAKVLVHPLDYRPLTNRDDFEHYNSIDRWEDLMPFDDYYQIALSMNIVEADIERNLKADATFQDREIIDFGHTKAEVLHTPGHSAGHCCFYFPNEDFLFSGDICLTKAGPWYGEIYADPEDMIRSINRIIELNPARLTSCHVNEVYTDGAKRLVEFRDRIYKREERIYRQIRKNPETLDQLTEHKLIYRMHPTPFVVFWEKLMLLKHLKLLETAGRVEKNEDGFFRAI